jgi:hypothetical protein
MGEGKRDVAAGREREREREREFPSRSPRQAGGRAGCAHLAARRAGRRKSLGWASGVAFTADGDVDDARARESEDVDAAVAAGANAHRRRRVAAKADGARVGQAVPWQAVVAPVSPAAHTGSGGGPRIKI